MCRRSKFHRAGMCHAGVYRAGPLGCTLACLLTCFGAGPLACRQACSQQPPAADSPSTNSSAGEPAAPGHDSAADDSAGSGSGGNEPWPTQTVPTPSLPQPPEPLQRLLTLGKVDYVFYDARQLRRKFQAETRYSLQYNSKINFRWRAVGRSGGRRTLVVRPQFDQLEFEIKHEILLPIAFAGEGFYDQQLVRHEFDHVRISTDPRFLSLFRNWVAEELTVLRTQCASDADFNLVAKELVDERVEQIFQRVLSLIQLRYQELDQTTRHGVLVTPETFFTGPDASDIEIRGEDSEPQAPSASSNPAAGYE